MFAIKISKLKITLSNPPLSTVLTVVLFFSLQENPVLGARVSIRVRVV